MRFQNIVTQRGYVYILSNKTRRVLYIGVTGNLVKRVWLHRQGLGSEFTQKYRTKYLIHYESFKHIERAINREKQLKNWHREWKLNLIREHNPKFRDLWPKILLRRNYF
ncbi:GIY-YIG nuclease family protein [Fodinibius halophilus]|uniref:GIY-YIG nuclease family protein n=1 Tax=Fodinibius halophilus TaxID=1736908 RepID=A0A6M1T9N6_9BACT|nr:GIY-YIG nuclease family protein [Fodinibius halophilus]NGP89223.1 GIY-YIG nuclease family protein [Fodinibius halophilus]